jgi:UDP-N-acetylmuramoyl-L-alanyl-D-glutamate--2,6-diaminopimelate ligase
MKTLRNILTNIDYQLLQGDIDISINNIAIDTRKIEKDDVYVAIKGVTVDGHKFIDKAIENGAKVIIGENFESLNADVVFIKIENSRQTFGLMCCNYFNHPSKKITLIGITGTNGKTSIASMLYNLFKLNGNKCGLLSTIQNIIVDDIYPATHTTSDAWNINLLLNKMVEKNCAYAFMECSSHAIDQDRIIGLDFDGVVFTNITHDHLDYHQTFDEYIKAKKKLFDNAPNHAFALVNTDDKRGNIMLQNCSARHLSYAMNSIADYHVKILENTFDGLFLSINNKEVYTKILGKFNAYNLVAVYAIATQLGIEEIEALKLLSLLPSTQGRFEVCYSTKEKIVGIIDYAHTPDALKNVLETVIDINKGKQKIITVVGCGGDRDATKRPIMGMLAAAMSNKCILTSDNPRSEDPKSILEEMRKGILAQHTSKALIIEDRKEAIRTAISLANAGDIIVLAGKGHEDYQEIKGVKYPFDDTKILLQSFKEMNK